MFYFPKNYFNLIILIADSWIHSVIKTTNYHIICGINYFIVFKRLKNDKTYIFFFLKQTNLNVNWTKGKKQNKSVFYLHNKIEYLYIIKGQNFQWGDDQLSPPDNPQCVAIGFYEIKKPKQSNFQLVFVVQIV